MSVLHMHTHTTTLGNPLGTGVAWVQWWQNEFKLVGLIARVKGHRSLKK